LASVLSIIWLWVYCLYKARRKLVELVICMAAKVFGDTGDDGSQRRPCPASAEGQYQDSENYCSQERHGILHGGKCGQYAAHLPQAATDPPECCKKARQDALQDCAWRMPIVRLDHQSGGYADDSRMASLSSTGPVPGVLFVIESSSESFQLAMKSPRPLELFSSGAVF
jgi:hypothetical protein